MVLRIQVFFDVSGEMALKRVTSEMPTLGAQEDKREQG
jgi:hypothetical protein